MKKITKQEEFWQGDFGDKYINRNNNDSLLSSKISLFSKILFKTYKINSVIEYGANIGFNLLAIKKLIPKIDMASVEINKNACKELKKLKEIKYTINQS